MPTFWLRALTSIPAANSVEEVGVRLIARLDDRAVREDERRREELVNRQALPARHVPRASAHHRSHHPHHATVAENGGEAVGGGRGIYIGHAHAAAARHTRWRGIRGDLDRGHPIHANDEVPREGDARVAAILEAQANARAGGPAHESGYLLRGRGVCDRRRKVAMGCCPHAPLSCCLILCGTSEKDTELWCGLSDGLAVRWRNVNGCLHLCDTDDVGGRPGARPGVRHRVVEGLARARTPFLTSPSILSNRARDTDCLS